VPHGIDNPSSVSVSVRPESIQLVPNAANAMNSGDDNCLAGKISSVTFLGASRRVDVMSDGVSLQVTTPADSALPPDGEVLLMFAPERAVALSGKTP
jgi:hypothetical protein